MPPYWRTLLERFNLVGRKCSIPAEQDMSRAGAVFEILDEQGIHSEQTEFYPGIAVADYGFVPVGTCLLGMDDPYFINDREGDGGPLYRVYHEVVVDQEDDLDSAVAIVLEDYRDLIRYVDS